MTDRFDVESRLRDRLRRADLPGAPVALHQRVGEIASRPTPSTPPDVVGMPHRAGRPGLLVAAAFVAVAILGVLGVGGRFTLFEAHPSASASNGPGPTTAEGSPAPLLGPIVDGVPTAIDGRAVLRGDALRSALAATTDDSPILAGGWFHDHRPAAVPCPLILRRASRLDLCTNGFDLFDGTLGIRLTKIAAGDPARDTFTLAYDALRPVVLEVATHDPECTPDVDKAMSCSHTPVFRAVAWLGDTPTPRPSASPMPTPPGTSLSRAEAVALAAARVAGGGLVCAVPALHSTAFGVLDPQGDDPWMWVVVFTLGPDRSALVALDYRTGAFIQSDTGSGARTCP